VGLHPTPSCAELPDSLTHLHMETWQPAEAWVSKAVPRKLRLRRIIITTKVQNKVPKTSLAARLGFWPAGDNGDARRSQIVKHSAGSPGVLSHRLVRILNRDLIRRLINHGTRGICRRISDCAVLGSVAFGLVCHTTPGPDCLKTCKPCLHKREFGNEIANATYFCPTVQTSKVPEN
jgi:hypothetical protein